MPKRINGTVVLRGAYKESRHIRVPGGRFYGLPLPHSMRCPEDPEVVTDLDEAARHRERVAKSQKARGVE